MGGRVVFLTPQKLRSGGWGVDQAHPQTLRFKANRIQPPALHPLLPPSATIQTPVPRDSARSSHRTAPCASSASRRYVLCSRACVNVRPSVLTSAGPECPPPRCAVLCRAVLCCSVRCAFLCCALLCCAVLCCGVLCCAVLPGGTPRLAGPILGPIRLQSGPAQE